MKSDAVQTIHILPPPEPERKPDDPPRSFLYSEDMDRDGYPPVDAETVETLATLHPHLELVTAKDKVDTGSSASLGPPRQWALEPQSRTCTIRFYYDLETKFPKAQHTWPGWTFIFALDLLAIPTTRGASPCPQKILLLSDESLTHDFHTLNAPCLNTLEQVQQVMVHRRKKPRANSKVIDVVSLEISVAPFSVSELSNLAAAVCSHVETFTIDYHRDSERSTFYRAPAIGLDMLHQCVDVVESQMPRLRRVNLQINARRNSSLVWPTPTARAPIDFRHPPLEIFGIEIDCELEVWSPHRLHLPSIAANLARLCDVDTKIDFTGYDSQGERSMTYHPDFIQGVEQGEEEGDVEGEEEGDEEGNEEGDMEGDETRDNNSMPKLFEAMLGYIVR